MSAMRTVAAVILAAHAVSGFNVSYNASSSDYEGGAQVRHYASYEAFRNEQLNEMINRVFVYTDEGRLWGQNGLKEMNVQPYIESAETKWMKSTVDSEINIRLPDRTPPGQPAISPPREIFHYFVKKCNAFPRGCNTDLIKVRPTYSASTDYGVTLAWLERWRDAGTISTKPELRAKGRLYAQPGPPDEYILEWTQVREGRLPSLAGTLPSPLRRE